jgi:hypothetical protein
VFELPIIPEDTTAAPEEYWPDPSLRRASPSQGSNEWAGRAAPSHTSSLSLRPNGGLWDYGDVGEATVGDLGVEMSRAEVLVFGDVRVR